MVQLVVKEQGGTDLHYLDVSDVSIKGNYSAKEIQDLASQKSDFTQAFTLPFTQVNNDFFSHFYDVVSVDGSFNSSIKCEADIYVDSNIVFSGYLQLLNVNNSTKYYEALVFGVISNIATSLDEKQLNELDLSEFSHLLTAANVEDSWSGNTTYTTSVGQTGEEILYPIADYGYDYNNASLNGTINEGVSATKLKPAINVKVLFEKILASIGYTISSTFFASDFFAKQYMTLANETESVATTFQDAFRVGLSANNTFTSGFPTPSNTAIDFDTVGSFNLFDLGGNYDESATTPFYEIPITGFYQFKINLRYSFANTNNTTAKLQLRKIGSATYSQEIQGQFNGVNNDFFRVENSGEVVDITSDEIFLNANDQVYLAVSLSSASGNTLTILQQITPGLSNFSLFAAPIQSEGSTVDLSANNNILPTEKQVDFISAICSRYNLIIEMDKGVTNQLNIEPAQDYFDAGTSKDWSNKIDLNKDVKLKPTNEFRKERILMSDLEDEDRLNYYWQDTFDEVYNSYTAAFSGDFGKDDLEVKSIFSSWNTKRPQGHDMLIALPYKWDNGEPTFVNIKPRLFAYSGLKDCQPYRFWSYTTGSYSTKTSYPFCNHYLISGDTVVSTDSDIRFKTKYAFDLQFYVDSQPVNDTYAKCWRKYLNNIYSKEARILTANFYLTPEDIAQFKYNDKIFVQNSYYRINKITSYALGKNQSTKVELIKSIEGVFNDSMLVFDCDLELSSTNFNGTTSWVDSAGASATPTQSCCEANNFSFIDNVCYWNTTVLPHEPVPSPIVFNQNKNVNTTGGEVIVGQTASSVVVNESTQIYLEGTVRRIGEEAKVNEVLSYDEVNEHTEWVTRTEFPSTVPIRGQNIGTIYDTEMYLTAADFTKTNSSSGAGGVMAEYGQYVTSPSSSVNLISSFQLPLGYRVNSVVVYGGNTASTFSVRVSDVDDATSTEVGASTAINSTVTLTGQNAAKGTFWSIIVVTGHTGRYISGAKLILERVAGS